MSFGGGRKTPSGSRDASRDNSRNRQPSKERSEFKEPAPPPLKEMSKDDVTKKAKATLDEFLHIQDLQVCVKLLSYFVDNVDTFK